MKYSQIRRKLNRSQEFASMPDRWAESIPFRCRIQGEDYDAFLYFVTGKEKTVFKKALGFNRVNDMFLSMDFSEFASCFGINTDTFTTEQINDYDRYLSDIDRYEELYAKSCPRDSFGSNGKEMYELFKRIVGDSLFTELYTKVAAEFIIGLQEGK